MPARFPKPWTIIELEHCYVVVDAAEFRIAYLYFETRAPHLVVGDERMAKPQALMIARKIAEIGRA